MPKVAKELKDIDVRRLTFGINSAGKPVVAFHAVGGVAGLNLRCGPPRGPGQRGSRSWVLRVVIGTKRRDIGLGGYPSVTLSEARKLARELKQEIAAGIDPVLKRREEASKLRARRAQMTSFGEIAESWIELKSDEWETAKQVNRARQYFNDYVYPHIGSLPIQEIQRGHIVDILNPIWKTKTSTAKRLIGYVRSVISKGIIELDLADKITNPAVWEGNLEFSFPKASKLQQTEHYRSIDWRKLPEFIATLCALHRPERPRPDVLCLIFSILCVTRSSATRLMEWDEIDLDAKTWTIPRTTKEKKSRKAKIDWYVPLSTQAIRILKAQSSSEFKKGRVFNTLAGGEIPDSYLSSLPKAMGYDATQHGFRSTFKEWCRETDISEDASELSLQHRATTSTRAAYARSQLVEIRRKISNEYATYAFSKVDNAAAIAPTRNLRQKVE